MNDLQKFPCVTRLGVNLSPMITSKDLLYKALDYDNFWNSSSKRMKNTVSSRARKIQLESLLAAFNISKTNIRSASQDSYDRDESYYSESFYSVTGRSVVMNRYEYIKSLSSFRYFTTGEFIADADMTLYKNILKQINQNIGLIFPNYKESIKYKRVNLVYLFSKLYLYRQSIHFTLNLELDTTVEENLSIEESYSLYLKRSIAERMNKSLLEIDKILCSLIDPQKRKFTEEEIGYVDYDFKALDKESIRSLNK